jgi:hypothetical protein
MHMSSANELDAELFEGIHREVFETGNIQDTYVEFRRIVRNGFIHNADDLIE